MAKQYDSSDDEGSSNESRSDGFYSSHHCTDPVCCVIFAAGIAFFSFIFIWGLVNGNTARLTHGINVNGDICGVTGDVVNAPFLYYCPQFFDPSNASASLEVDTSNPVCVPRCPEGPDVEHVDPATVYECGIDSHAYLTRVTADWYCLPESSLFARAAEKVERRVENVRRRFSADMFGMEHAWPVMLAVVALATLLGYTYLFLLRALAKGLLWLCIIVSIVAFLGFGWYLWAQELPDVQQVGEAGQANAQTWNRVFAVCCWVLAFLVAALACCCGGELELSTACIKSGTEVIWQMPLLLLAPLVKACAKALFACLYFWGFIHLWSTAEVTGTAGQRHFAFTGFQYVFLFTYVIIGYWMLTFITALYQFSIAYAVAKYYMTDTDEDGHKEVACCAVGEGTTAGVVFHAGSLAMGSALITVLELFQRVLEYAELHNQAEGGNAAVRCVLSCCLCCCRCLEGFVQFVSKNAYIDMAITSGNFCQSVRNIAHVVIDHGAAMAILNGATVIFQVVGVFAITATCGFLANLMLTNGPFGDEDGDWYVSSPALGTVLACLLGLIVSWSFMTVFDVATDTLLICYAEDRDHHAGMPTHASPEMRKLYTDAEAKVEKNRRLRDKQAAKTAKKFGPANVE